MPENVTLIEQLTLAANVQLSVLEANQCEQAALVIVCGSGSHQEPKAWLGLAHFLEHLVFRGSQQYPETDGLMAYVQRVGGKVNAQTQANLTSFHFELAPTSLLPATARLVDLLVHPLLQPTAITSEREVIEQEYQLYAQQPGALQQAAVGLALAAEHPLQLFRCGNRRSLALEQPEFIRQLKAFHQHAYLQSPLRIVLCCTADDWQLQKSAWLSLLTPLLTLRRQAKQPPTKIQLLPKAVIRQHITQQALPQLALYVPIEPALPDELWLTQVFQQQLDPAQFSSIQGVCQAVSVQLFYQQAGQSIVLINLTFSTLVVDDLSALYQHCQQQLQHAILVLSGTAARHDQQVAKRRRALTASAMQQALQYSQQTQPVDYFSAIVQPLQKLQQQLAEQQCLVQLVNLGPVTATVDVGLTLHAEVSYQNLTQASGLPRLPQPASAEQSVPSSSLAPQLKSLLQPLTSRAVAQTLVTAYLGWSLTSLSISPYWALRHAEQALQPLVASLAYQGAKVRCLVANQQLFVQLTTPADYLMQALAIVEWQLAKFDQLELTNKPLKAAGLRAYLAQLEMRLLTEASSVAPSLTLAMPPDHWLLFGLNLKTQQRVELASASPIMTAPLLPVIQGHTPSFNCGYLALVIPLGVSELDYIAGQRVAQSIAHALLTILQQRLRVELGCCYALTCYAEVLLQQPMLVIGLQSGSELAYLQQQLQLLLQQWLATTNPKTLLLQLQSMAKQRLAPEMLQDLALSAWLQHHSLSQQLAHERSRLQRVTKVELQQLLLQMQDSRTWYWLSE